MKVSKEIVPYDISSKMLQNFFDLKLVFIRYGNFNASYKRSKLTFHYRLRDAGGVEGENVLKRIQTRGQRISPMDIITLVKYTLNCGETLEGRDRRERKR